MDKLNIMNFAKFYKIKQLLQHEAFPQHLEAKINNQLTSLFQKHYSDLEKEEKICINQRILIKHSLMEYLLKLLTIYLILSIILIWTLIFEK